MLNRSFRFLFGILTSFILLITVSETAWASEVSTEMTFGPTVSYNEESGYYIRIEDEANLFGLSEKTKLEESMKPVSAYGNVVFVSISNNPYYSSESYAKSYYEQHFGTSSGILFLIDMDYRYIWIYSSGEIYDTITTAYANTITDNVYAYASDGEYLLCASKAFEQVNTLLGGRHIAQPMKYISNALLSIAIALLINYFLVMILSRSRKATNRQLLNGIFSKTEINNPRTEHIKQTKSYSPQTSSSSGARSSGSRSGGGGGSRGGGGGHRF